MREIKGKAQAEGARSKLVVVPVRYTAVCRIVVPKAVIPSIVSFWARLITAMSKRADIKMYLLIY